MKEKQKDNPLGCALHIAKNNGFIGNPFCKVDLMASAKVENEGKKTDNNKQLIDISRNFHIKIIIWRCALLRASNLIND